MLEIVGSLLSSRTPVHGGCGRIAAHLALRSCAAALVLLGLGPAWADEPQSPAPAESAAPAETAESPEPSSATPAVPSGPPPEVTAADAGWNERPAESSLEAEPSAPSWSPDVGLGVQVFGASGKAMVGLSLRVGDELFWGELEFTPIWLTRTSSDFDGSFLGNQWGFYFSLAPLRTRYVEALVGVGLDVFHLWGIHSDEAFTALSFKGGLHGRPTKSVSVFATLRSYALHSGGVELGTTRERERTIPVLGSLGVEWRFE